MVLSSMIFGYQGGDIGDRGLNVIFWHNLNSFHPKKCNSQVEINLLRAKVSPKKKNLQVAPKKASDIIQELV